MFMGLLRFSWLLVSDGYEAKCISLNNQTCHARQMYININSNEPLYHPFTININKCG